MANGDDAERLVLVTGATGQQGGAVARHLLAQGFRVRGLTRDPEQESARALAGQGAEMAQGDLDDRGSIERALDGAWGVFSVQNFWETGYEREVGQGKALADAARAAGVGHFVYSSVGSAHRDTGIPHFDSKWEVEEHLRGTGLPYTILRPVFFLQNWSAYQGDYIRKGTLAQPLDPDRPLQQIDADDIGAFAAMAFAEPERWRGRELDLAGDELTMPQVAEAFSRFLGRPVSFVQLPWDQFEQAVGEESTIMYRWFNEVGYEADIAALRREHPGLATLETFLPRSEWAAERESGA